MDAGLLPSPCDLCVEASLDSHKRPIVAAKLGMIGLEQVLTDNGKFDVLKGAPTESDVGGRVSTDGLTRRRRHLCGQSRDISISCVKLEPLRQVEEGLQFDLMVRARTVVGTRDQGIQRTCDACFVMHEQMQKRIRAL